MKKKLIFIFWADKISLMMKNFMKKICNADFKFIKKQPNFKNYNKLDKANLIIFISSTMGYEALEEEKNCLIICKI